MPVCEAVSDIICHEDSPQLIPCSQMVPSLCQVRPKGEPNACSFELDFSTETRHDSDDGVWTRCFHVRTGKRRADAHHRKRVPYECERRSWHWQATIYSHGSKRLEKSRGALDACWCRMQRQCLRNTLGNFERVRSANYLHGPGNGAGQSHGDTHSNLGLE